LTVQTRFNRDVPLGWLGAAILIALIVAPVVGKMRGSSNLPAGGPADILAAVDLRQVKVGGELGRRLDITINNNLFKLDLGKDFLGPFRTRKYTGPTDGTGPFIGIGNLIDSAVRLAANSGDPALLAWKEHLISEIINSQDADGYIGALPPDERTWRLWDLHEQSYIISGLVADYQLFGEQRSLAAARKLADYIISRWSTKPARWLQGGPIPVAEDLALTGVDVSYMNLYAATGDQCYRDFCVRQLKLGAWNREIVLGRHDFVLGHVYAYCSHCVAQLKLYSVQPDEKLLASSRRATDFMTANDGMTITGGSGQFECWNNDQNGREQLGETCATTYQVLLYDHLLRLQGDSRWGDLIERTLYNAAFGAQSPDGRQLRYYTPFEGDRVYFWSDAYCCPNNYRKLIATLPQLIYYRAHQGVVINLYTPSRLTLDGGSGLTIGLRQETDYPSSGRVTVHVELSRAASFPLQLRIPRWCANARAAVNGKAITPAPKPGAFLRIDRKWKDGDRVVLDMPMRWRFVKGRQRQAGRVAVMRGPVVYALNPARVANLDVARLARLVLLPASLKCVVPDHSARPGGTAGHVKADYDKAGRGDLSLTLTEFPDPDGKWTYFRVPDMSAAVDDELIVAGR
jgi:uncharacterized protein